MFIAASQALNWGAHRLAGDINGDRKANPRISHDRMLSMTILLLQQLRRSTATKIIGCSKGLHEANHNAICSASLPTPTPTNSGKRFPTPMSGNLRSR